jgi:hypothetical protein
MAATPQFASTPKVGIGQLSAANTNRDGSGTVVTVVSAGANGTRIDAVTIEATATTTAGMVRLYLHDGANARLFDEVAVSAITPSGTVAAFSAQRLYSATQPVLLPSGWSLRASTHNAEAFNVVAFGGDF